MLADPKTMTNGYRAYLQGGNFGYIGFYKWALALFQTNKRRATCLQCKEKIEQGEGVYHEQFRNNGYVHLECAKKMIFKYGGEKGFTVSVLMNLQACEYNPAKYSAEDVVQSIRISDTERVM